MLVGIGKSFDDRFTNKSFALIHEFLGNRKFKKGFGTCKQKVCDLVNFVLRQ